MAMKKTKSDGMAQATRLQDLVRTFQARRAGLTLDELVELYGVTRRTIYRDLEHLAQAGYPLYSVAEGHQKRWKFHDRFSEVTPLTLSMSELISLYLTRGQIRYLEGTPFAEDMDAVFGKLEKTLSPKSREQLRLFERKFLFIPDAPKTYAGRLDLLYDIMDALIRQRVCRMTYRSPRKKQTRRWTIEPLTLATHRQGLYLFARKRGEQKVLTFAIDRIQRLEPTGESFDYPESFRPAARIEGAFGIVGGGESHRVRIRFAPDVAHLIAERRWHPTQKVRRHKDGTLTLEMDVSGIGEELVRFVLAYGAAAEVLEPAPLRDAVAAELRKAAGVYG